MMGIFNPLAAQQFQVSDMSSAQRMQSMLPNADLLEKFEQQRSQSSGTVASCTGTSHPLFTFAGPDMQSHFWNDPLLSGQTLVLQGQLMKEMGYVLIKQGREMLGEKSEVVTDEPMKEEK